MDPAYALGYVISAFTGGGMVKILDMIFRRERNVRSDIIAHNDAIRHELRDRIVALETKYDECQKNHAIELSKIGFLEGQMKGIEDYIKKQPMGNSIQPHPDLTIQVVDKLSEAPRASLPTVSDPREVED